MSRAQTSAKRRERRKGRVMLKRGLMREAQKHTGHHATSWVHDAVDLERAARMDNFYARQRARAIEILVPPLRVPLQVRVKGQ